MTRRPEPYDESAPVERPAALLGHILFDPEKREDPMFGEDDGPDGHEDEPVDGHVVQEFQEKDRETGKHGRGRPGDQGDLPTRPIGGHRLEGQSRPVERRIGRCPARQEETERPGQSGGLESHAPGVHFAPDGRDHDP